MTPIMHTPTLFEDHTHINSLNRKHILIVGIRLCAIVTPPTKTPQYRPWQPEPICLTAPHLSEMLFPHGHAKPRTHQFHCHRQPHRRSHIQTTIFVVGRDTVALPSCKHTISLHESVNKAEAVLAEKLAILRGEDMEACDNIYCISNR